MRTFKTRPKIHLANFVKKVNDATPACYTLILLFFISCSVYVHAGISAENKVFRKYLSYYAPAISDKEIANAIETEFNVRTLLAAANISVSATSGIVSLSGTVDNILAKDRAEQIALAVKGVKGVVNRIQVKASGRTDEAIRKDVEKALLMNHATDSYEVKAQVTDGKVTLTGKVDSWAESQLAMMVAKKVKGVREVQNSTQLVYKSDRPDYEITTEVKQQLRNDIRVGDAMIDVKVNDGAVTLTGTVGSASEKIQAQYNAWVAGVKSVDIDKLNVDPEADFDALRKDKFIIKPDAELKKVVSNALLFDPRVNSLNITGTVDKGVVTLTGMVENLQAKRAAEEDAKNVVGVMGVINNISVDQQQTTQTQLNENVDWTLTVDPVVEKYEINTEINNGHVTLTGTVDSYFEKVHAADLVSQLAGVKEVTNNLQVRDTYSYLFWYDVDPALPVPKESDEEIKKDIKDQIWWSPFVDHEEVSVDVKNGKAILNGTVDSWNEAQSAIENAFEGGAVAVDNKLIIDRS